MRDRIIKFVLIAAAGFGIYWLMNHHLIFFGASVEVLPKVETNFTHTFYSVGGRKDIQYKGLDTILANEDLLAAGIDDLLIDRGLVTEEEVRKALDQIR